MARRAGSARTVDAAAVGSRWWYWVAAVPAIAGFGGLTFGWVALATTAEFGTALGTDPVEFALSLSALVVGAPLAPVLLVFPVATYLDARALTTAGADWRPTPARWAALAGASALTVLGSVPFACYYCYRRYRAVGF